MNARPPGPVVVLRSFSSLTAGKLSGDVATFVLFILVSRVFGQEGIGAYSLAMAIGGILAILSELGTTTFTIRELAHSSEAPRRLFGRILSLRLILVGVALLVLLVSLPLFPFPAQTLQVIAAVTIYQFLYQLVVSFGAVFIALERPIFAGLFDGGFRALASVGAIAAILLGAQLLMALALMPVIAVFSTVAASVVLSNEIGRPRLVARPSELLRTGRAVLPYGLSSIIANVQQRLDVTVLGFVAGVSAAGVYNVAYRPVFMFWFIPAFLAISVLPLASRLHSESPRQLDQLFRRSLNVAVLAGIPMAAGPDVISLVFGDEFSDSVGLLRLLAWLLLLAFLRFTIGAFLTATGRQVQRTRAQAWVFLASALLFAILIPAYGTVGAALAALLSEGILVVMFAIHLRPALGWPAIGSRLLLGAIGAGAFMALFTLLMPSAPLAVVVLGSVALYVATLSLFPQIRRDELRFSLQLLRGRRSDGV